MLASSFLKAYEKLIAQEQLTADHDQQKAASKLHQLFCVLARRRRLKLWHFLQPLLWPPGRRSRAEGAYLWGGVGRGKTMLMDLFFETAPVKKKRRVHFLEFMQEAHERLRALREKEDGDPIPSLARQIRQETDLLCLDEFQVHDIADASILGRLFSALFDEDLVFMATSNRAPDDLYQGGLNRQRFLPFIHLLKEKIDIIAISAGTDYRREAMIGTQRYHINDAHALDQSFQLLAHGRAAKGRTAKCFIEVQGRKIAVPQQAMGVAQFHFDDLCARPLGGADYLAIARAFHTILLDGIPVLTPEKRNEAKRFVHLIDVLYDNRVLLIANAADQPDRLYPQGDGRFEFERTISRLNEMQSADYMPQKTHGQR